MAKMAEAIEDFLESGGSGLGYDGENLPNFEDWKIVLDYGVWVWEYRGQTKEEYYGIG